MRKKVRAALLSWETSLKFSRRKGLIWTKIKTKYKLSKIRLTKKLPSKYTPNWELKHFPLALVSKELFKGVLYVHGSESLFKGGRARLSVWTLFSVKMSHPREILMVSKLYVFNIGPRELNFLFPVFMLHFCQKIREIIWATNHLILRLYPRY